MAKAILELSDIVDDKVRNLTCTDGTPLSEWIECLEMSSHFFTVGDNQRSQKDILYDCICDIASGRWMSTSFMIGDDVKNKVGKKQAITPDEIKNMADRTVEFAGIIVPHYSEAIFDIMPIARQTLVQFDLDTRRNYLGKLKGMFSSEVEMQAQPQYSRLSQLLPTLFLNVLKPAVDEYAKRLVSLKSSDIRDRTHPFLGIVEEFQQRFDRFMQYAHSVDVANRVYKLDFELGINGKGLTYDDCFYKKGPGYEHLTSELFHALINGNGPCPGDFAAKMWRTYKIGQANGMTPANALVAEFGVPYGFQHHSISDSSRLDFQIHVFFPDGNSRHIVKVDFPENHRGVHPFFEELDHLCNPQDHKDIISSGKTLRYLGM
ncbi:MAG: hypothetical protein ABII01_04505 [Candidatus Woesearchaeota archaeon]